MPYVIANMVARNEEHRYLEQVLTRLVDQVDLITFTDDASTDRTAEIARDLGAAVQQLEVPMFVTNEGAFRQQAWEHLAQHALPDAWVLSIDADEEFYPGEGYEAWLNQSRWPVLGITFYHMWNDTHYRVDKAWAPVLSSRMFRYLEGGQFRQRRLASGSEPTYVGQLVAARHFAKDTGMRMKHLGYARDEDKQAKFDRYMDLDKGEFHSLNHLKSILDPNPTLREWHD